MIERNPNKMTLDELQAICDGLGIEFVIEDGGITEMVKKEKD